MTTIDEELGQLTSARTAYETLMKEKGESLIKRIIQRMFEIGDGKIRAIAWNQWAPNFNDGEPCIFHVRERGWYGVNEPKIARWQDDHWLEDNEELGLTHEQEEQIRKLDGQLEAIDDEVFRKAFGSDCQVQAVMTNGVVVFTKDWVDHD